jgi:hypothetical protein
MNGLFDVLILPAAGGPTMALPAPYWLFTVLHWLTFTLHLIAMNILVGGVLLLVISRTGPLRKHLFESLTKLFPTVLAATITLGVAPLLFLQVIYGKFFYSASIISGWNWFLIIPVVIIVYYLLYLVSMRKNLSDSARIDLLVLALIGFVYVSYTLTMISDLAEKPDLWGELYRASPAGMSLNPSFGETIFRWLHILAGAMAVFGIVVQLFSIYHKKVKGNRDLLRYGGRIFMLGAIKASLLGLIYFFILDKEIIVAFLGSPGLHAVIGAIILNIIALVLSYRAVSAERPHLKIWTTAVLVFAGVFCMVIARHSLRLIYLEGHFDPTALAVNPQWSVFTVFIVLFIGGLITLFWMIRKFFTSSRASAQE